MTQAILRLPAVKERTGLPRATIYAYIKEGRFPAPLALGPRSVGWREEDVAAWLDARPTKSWALHASLFR